MRGAASGDPLPPPKPNHARVSLLRLDGSPAGRAACVAAVITGAAESDDVPGLRVVVVTAGSTAGVSPTGVATVGGTESSGCGSGTDCAAPDDPAGEPPDGGAASLPGRLDDREFPVLTSRSADPE
jgi:hypothetical protein